MASIDLRNDAILPRPWRGGAAAEVGCEANFGRHRSCKRRCHCHGNHEIDSARGQRVTAIFLPRSRCPKAIAEMDVAPGRAIRDCGGQILGGGIGDVVVDAPIDGLTLWRMDFPRAKACFWPW